MSQYSIGVVEAVRALYAKHGEIKPSLLLSEAKKKASPLHGVFQWDDGKAAELYRLQQARGLIRQVTVVVEDHEEVLVHVPAAEYSDNSKEGSYKAIGAVVANRSEFSRAFDEARSKLNAAQRSVTDLESYAKSEGKETEHLMLALKSIGVAKSALDHMHH